MTDSPRLADIGPPPPGTKELREIAPLLAPERLRRRLPWWVRVGLVTVVVGAAMLAFGVWRIERQARAVLMDERNAGAAAGVVRAGFEGRDLGPRDAKIAVLLLHGFRSSPADFNDLPQRLAERGVRVVVPLLPGHGTTSEELALVVAQDWTRFVQAAYNDLGAQHEQVHVAGFSMGAAAALVALADTPPTRLALVAPYFRVTPRWYLQPSVESLARLAAHFVDYIDTGPVIHGIVDRTHAAAFPFCRVLPTDAALQSFELAAAARSDDVLERHTGAVLTIVCTHDTIADPRSAHDAHQRLGSNDKVLVTVDESDHVLLWDHDAERVAAALIPFLTEP